jgi:ATP/maltotriose-dependent transcriptional regulator MalT
LRALGEQWGIAVGLTMLAEFTELRADHAASIEALTEAAALGRETGVWGDLGYVEGRLAVIYARAGDLDKGYAEIGRARRAMEARGGHMDADRWVSFMLAELASLAGDHAEVARRCEAVLATIADNEAPWWESMRAQVKARLAVAVLKQGNPERCVRLLREAVDAAAAWWERPSLAVVLDACAVYTLHGADGDDATHAAERAARLLGAAHAVRGAFDESSLDAPPARAQARATLGADAFQARYDAALASDYEAALALARELVSGGPRELTS